MKITFISGSGRKGSQSGKVTRFAENLLRKQHPGVETHLIDLAGNPLPLWDEGVWDGEERWKKLWTPYAEQLKSSDGFVVTVPEWHGMAPGAIKNFFHLCGGTHVLGHKPAMLVGVSASRGGAYPVTEMRMTAGKNTFVVFTPDHVIVRNVEGVLNTPEPQSDDDKFYRERIGYSMNVLLKYAEALKMVRESGVIDYKSYPSGM